MTDPSLGEARQLAAVRDALTKAQECRYVQKCQECRMRVNAALSALDALGRQNEQIQERPLTQSPVVKACEFGCGPTGNEYVTPGFGIVPACPVHGWVCVLLAAKDARIERYCHTLADIASIATDPEDRAHAVLSSSDSQEEKA